MSRIERIGNATLYLGDCREILPTLRRHGAVVTSPPYNMARFHEGKGRDKKYSYDGFSDDLPEPDYQDEQLRIIEAMPADWLFYNHKDRIREGRCISPMEWLIRLKGWVLLQTVVVDGRSGANVDKRRFFPVHEYVFVLAREAGAKLRNDACKTTVWTFPQINRADTGHPAAFHPALPATCMAACPATSYLDPYMGTGSSGVAAVGAGVSFTGIERSSAYFDIACERVAAAAQQRRLIA